MDTHDLIPITLFIVVGITASLGLYIQFLARKNAQDTLRAAIAAGQPLDATAVKALSEKQTPTPDSDLRSGISGIAIGIGFIFAAAYAHLSDFDQDLESILTIIGIIATFSGIGNFASAKIRAKLPNPTVAG